MIETIIYKFLESKLSVPVLMEKPKSKASHFILIERTGGAQNNHISSGIITIQSYAPSMLMAAELNKEVKYWMLDDEAGLVTLNEVASVSLNGDYNFTDTTTKEYRYQAVFDVVHY